MLNVLSSVYISDVTPQVNNLSFNRDRIVSEDAEVHFNMRSEFTDADENHPNFCRLILSADAKASQPESEDIFTLELGIEYIFTITNQEAFNSCTDEEKIKLCTIMAFLDFRMKLMQSMISTGMSGFKLPFSVDRFTKS